MSGVEGLGNGRVTGYAYDMASRLASLGQDVPSGGAANDQFFGFSYNPASQILQRTASNAAYQWTSGQPGTQAYAVNGLNQYTSVAGQAFSYDGRGNLTNDGTKTYLYDSLNRLVSSNNGTSVTYDPTGRIAWVSLSGTTTRFLYDGTQLIAEHSGSGQLLRRYVHGGGVDEPILWYEGTGTSDKRYLYADERGSIIGVEQGGSLVINRYDEYGQPGPTHTRRFGYTGQAWLPELSLWHYKARAYNPRIGRFMQTDPIGTQDQINLYAYVGNDPVNKSDPTGLKCDNDDYPVALLDRSPAPLSQITKGQRVFRRDCDS